MPATLLLPLLACSAHALAVQRPGPSPGSLDALFDGRGPVGLSTDVDMRGGRFGGFGLSYGPPGRGWGARLEAGHLGPGDARNALLGPSPYLNLKAGAKGSVGGFYDYRAAAQVGFVDVSGRYFNDPPGPDPGLDALVSRLAALADGAGLPQDQVSRFRGYASYEDPVRTDRLVMGSLLTQLGGAYGLWGPIDLAWTAGGLLKASHLFPNLALDASAGPRFALGKDRSIGLFGGMTRNFSPVGNRLLQDVFTKRVEGGFFHEDAPHATTVYTGPVPGWGEADLELRASRQWNADTRSDGIGASLWAEAWGRPVGLEVGLSKEYGPDIEFDRERCRLGLGCRFSRNLTGSVGYQSERIAYGDAALENKTAFAGFQLLWGGPVPGRVDASWKGEPRDRVTAAEIRGLAEVARGLKDTVDRAVDLAGLADSLLKLADPILLEALPGAVERLSDGLARLPPDARLELLGTLLDRGLTPAQEQLLRDLLERLARIDLEPLKEKLKEVRDLLAMMSDDGLLERLAVRVGRNRLMDSLNRTDEPIPYTSMRFRWSPAVFLAAGQILQSRASPPAPLTAADVQERIEPWLWREMARTLGMDRSSSPEAVTREFLTRVTAGVRARLRDSLDQDFLSRLPSLNLPEAVSALLAQLPQDIREGIQSRYGADLSGLLPPGLPSKEALERLLDAAVDQAMRDKLGPLADRAAAEAVRWVARSIRKAINTTLLQTLAAARELDRLNLDQGRKAHSLGVDMMQDSLGNLDERRGRARRVLISSAARLEDL